MCCVCVVCLQQHLVRVSSKQLGVSAPERCTDKQLLQYCNVWGCVNVAPFVHEEAPRPTCREAVSQCVCVSSTPTNSSSETSPLHERRRSVCAARQDCWCACAYVCVFVDAHQF